MPRRVEKARFEDTRTGEAVLDPGLTLMMSPEPAVVADNTFTTAASGRFSFRAFASLSRRARMRDGREHASRAGTSIRRLSPGCRFGNGAHNRPRIRNRHAAEAARRLAVPLTCELAGDRSDDAISARDGIVNNGDDESPNNRNITCLSPFGAGGTAAPLTSRARCRRPRSPSGSYRGHGAIFQRHENHRLFGNAELLKELRQRRTAGRQINFRAVGRYPD